jgi:hypothetical protein
MRNAATFIENHHALNQHDQDLFWRSNCVRSIALHDATAWIILTVLMTCLAGVVLGGLLTGSSHELTRLAANEVASAIPYPGRHTVDYAVEAQGTSADFVHREFVTLQLRQRPKATFIHLANHRGDR